VDLDRDDLPHPDCGFEWWHFHCQLTTARGTERGFVVLFTRFWLTTADGSRLPGHLLRWARSDVGGESYTSASWFDDGARAAHRLVVGDDAIMDPHVRTALLEGLFESRPYASDRLLPAPALVSADRLGLDYGGIGTLRKATDGSYQITVLADDERYELRLRPSKPPLQHSRDGRVPGRLYDDSDAAYSYLVPSAELRGTVIRQDSATRRGRRIRRVGKSQAVSGTAWYEHGFGGECSPLGDGQRVPDRAWAQLNLRLDNGWDVTAWSLEHVDIKTETYVALESQVVGCSPTGEHVRSTVESAGSDRWISMSTMNSYPTRWEIHAPELDLLVTVQVTNPRQEIPSMIPGSGTLHASATVRGTMAGRAVSGHAFIEVVPAQRVGDFERFLSRADPITRREISRLYPDDPSSALASALLGDNEASRDEALARQVHSALIKPIRHVVDGASKGLRSYATAAVIESLGISSTRYTPLMAVAELCHSGNLVIDDVEDDSTTRRDQPCAHLVYGVGHAINAGTAAYFSFERVLDEVSPNDPAVRLRSFQTLTRFMRLAHTGQAIDLTGHATAMDDAVASGDPSALLRQIRAGHRLKSGVPVGGLAEVGAVLVRATNAQALAVNEYFNAVGTAFQFTDDLLDLYGAAYLSDQDMDHPPKHGGEDLRAGKVTMPLAHAVALLPKAQIAELWHQVRGGTDLNTAREIARTLIDCGAADACYREGISLVNESWRKLTALLPNSYAKVMVHALGRYSALRRPSTLPVAVGPNLYEPDSVAFAHAAASASRT
jgi:geranylgeranyl pyrophosphate synthase/predicted secreted hydrolase